MLKRKSKRFVMRDLVGVLQMLSCSLKTTEAVDQQLLMLAV